MYCSCVSVTGFSNSLLGPTIVDKTAAFSAPFPYQEDLGAYFVFVKAQGHWLVHHTTAAQLGTCDSFIFSFLHGFR